MSQRRSSAKRQCRWRAEPMPSNQGRPSWATAMRAGNRKAPAETTAKELPRATPELPLRHRISDDGMASGLGDRLPGPGGRPAASPSGRGQRRQRRAERAAEKDARPRPSLDQEPHPRGIDAAANRQALGVALDNGLLGLKGGGACAATRLDASLKSRSRSVSFTNATWTAQTNRAWCRRAAVRIARTLARPCTSLLRS